MKKVGTATGNAGQEYFSTETASTDNSESVAGNVRHHDAQSSGTGNRGAFALDQSLAQAVGTRSDRGQCAQGAVDRGEPQERRSAGCADLGAAGADRSPVAVSGEASQRAGTGGSDDDSCTCRTGAGAHGAGEHGARTGQELRRTIARLQRTRHGSGES